MMHENPFMLQAKREDDIVKEGGRYKDLLVMYGQTNGTTD